MNIPRMYTIALEAFGYTEAEAKFLYLVATHSGYFILHWRSADFQKRVGEYFVGP